MAQRLPTNATVLLVQTDDDDRGMYAEYLRSVGVHTTVTGDVHHALGLARTVDLVITEVRVPGEFDGVELVRRLRGDGQTSRRPIIVLTASATGRDERRAREAGCDLFLVKPCAPSRVLAAIRLALVGAGRKTVARSDIFQGSPRAASA